MSVVKLPNNSWVINIVYIFRCFVVHQSTLKQILWIFGQSFVTKFINWFYNWEFISVGLSLRFFCPFHLWNYLPDISELFCWELQLKLLDQFHCSRLIICNEYFIWSINTSQSFSFLKAAYQKKTVPCMK